MTKRIKVLVSAYACEPNKGSEPGVGWNWVKQIAQFHEVWVITRANNRQAIERAMAEEPMPNVYWVYFDLPQWTRFWKKGKRGLHPYYYLWQLGAYIVGKRVHKEVGFDLVHHVTWGVYWMPSFLILLPVPLVWGPVGGGEFTPREFYGTFRVHGKLYEQTRNAIKWLGENDPFVTLDIKKSQIVLAKARETADRLEKLGTKVVKVYSESGMTGRELAHLKAMPLRYSHPFRLVSIGRLLHWKGFHLGLRAFSQLQREGSPSNEYWFIGDGPERGNLARLAQKLGVAEKVRFWGHLPRQQVLAKLAECDVLVHPSLHDSGGWVCLEAMAAGRPVICLDLGGPALQVTEETGFKVPALFPEQAVHDMAQAMRRLAHAPVLRTHMAEAARKRVAEYYDWDRKGEWIRNVYQEVSRLCL